MTHYLDDAKPANAVHIQCPECLEVVAIPITAVITDDNTLTVEPDPADLWAHAWTHTTRGAGP